MFSTRVEAMQHNAVHYSTGYPCKHGHTSPRYTKDGKCVECRVLLANSWNEKNKERHAVSVKKHNAKYVEKYKQQRNLRYAHNKTCELARQKIYYNLNKEVIAKRTSEYQKNNPAMVAAKTAKRRHAKAQRTPLWLSQDDYWMMEQAYELAALRTQIFGFAWEVDHVLPLRGKNVSGLHVPENLQVIPRVVNRSKYNHFEVT